MSSMWYLCCVLKHCIFVTYACASSRTSYFKDQRRFNHFVGFVVRIVTKYSETLSLKLDTDPSQYVGFFLASS